MNICRTIQVPLEQHKNIQIYLYIICPIANNNIFALCFDCILHVPLTIESKRKECKCFHYRESSHLCILWKYWLLSRTSEQDHHYHTRSSCLYSTQQVCFSLVYAKIMIPFVKWAKKLFHISRSSIFQKILHLYNQNMAAILDKNSFPVSHLQRLLIIFLW